MKLNSTHHRESVQAEYSKLAAEYDVRWSFYVRATTEATLCHLPAVLGEVLDVGCGTGALLERLAKKFPDSSLTGVDASAEMLQEARKRLPARIKLAECWAEALPYADASFDTVVSCNMFHYIREPQQALAEMLRILRPGGTLVITDWCDDYLACKACNLYLRWRERAHFQVYNVVQCRALLGLAGADNIQIEKYKISWLWGMMTATAQKKSLSSTSARS